MKIEHSHPSEYKDRWRIVRRDSLTTIAGNILSANEETGECELLIDGEKKTFCFGPNGIRIVGR